MPGCQRCPGNADSEPSAATRRARFAMRKVGGLTKYRTFPDVTRLCRPFMTSSTDVSQSHYGGSDKPIASDAGVWGWDLPSGRRGCRCSSRKRMADATVVTFMHDRRKKPVFDQASSGSQGLEKLDVPLGYRPKGGSAVIHLADAALAVRVHPRQSWSAGTLGL